MKHFSLFFIAATILLTLLTQPIPAAAATAPATTDAPAVGATDPDLELAHRLENAFVKVADQASKSVVVITITQKATPRGPEGEEEGNEFEGTPFERFFRQYGPQTPQHRDLDSQGSGVIIRKDGYILTNNHVIDRADKIKVRLKDGRELNGTVVGVDNRTDVAIIKVDAADLPAATLGNSDSVRVGQWAIAIGAPFQLEYSFTVGFVSATGRSAVWSRGGSAYEDYIQTDASINPGNSGGPLCDVEGRVVGINTLIRGLRTGIGFAIPINMAMEVATQLIETGHIVRPWLGIQIEALADNEELAAVVTDLKDGVVVRAIYPKTPAATSDLKPADIITAVDGVAVKTPRDLQKEILKKQVGQKVALSVYRNGKATQVSLATGELPDSPQFASNPLPPKTETEAGLGLTVDALTPDLAERFGAKAGGVVVTGVAQGSLAEQKGIQPGDVITEVDRTKVASPDEFKKALTAVDTKKGVLLYYQREGSSAFVVLKDAE